MQSNQNANIMPGSNNNAGGGGSAGSNPFDVFN
jgi:hypothetical protein